MISIKTNIQEVTSGLILKLRSIIDQDKVIRVVASTMAGEIRERIHEKGLDASGNAIGTYSLQYLKRRKKKFNRSGNKVIISLTRNLENDWSICQSLPIKTPFGYGLGFRKSENFDKANWNEERFGDIWKLTNDERKQVNDITSFEVRKRLK